MIRRCEKCGRDITEEWEIFKTYNGEEGHHNPPKMMMEKWHGNILNLCVDCHDKLHIEIVKILNKNSNLLKFCNSEYWTWKKMNGEQREMAVKEIVEFTNRWIKENDTNTRET